MDRLVVGTRIALALVAVACAASVPVRAAQDTDLRAVRGQVGYQQTNDAPFTRVFGSYAIGDDQIAVTRVSSNALLRLADSSEVALGAQTTIQIGAITQAAATAPTSMTLVAGAIRFAVKHPAGRASNYVFQTVSSQLAVRGTIGLYATGPNGDVVSCLDCAPGDVTVTAGGTSFPLLTGQTAFISIAGIVTIGATTTAVATSFSTTGLTTTAGAPSPFVPGIEAARAGAASATTTAAAAGAIGAAAIGTAVSAGNAKPSATPAPTPTQGGAVNLTAKNRAPATPLDDTPAVREPDALSPPVRRPR